MVRKNHRYPALHAEKQARFNMGNASSCLNLLDISLTFFNYLYVVLSCFVSLKWAFLARTVALCLLQGAGNAGDAHASDTRPFPRELWWVREGKAQAPHQRQPLQPLRNLNVIWMINQPTTGKRTSMICGLIWMASAVQNPSFGAIGRNPGNTQKSMLLTSNRGDRTNKMQPGGIWGMYGSAEDTVIQLSPPHHMSYWSGTLFRPFPGQKWPVSLPPESWSFRLRIKQ